MILDSLWKNIFHRATPEDLIKMMQKLPIFDGLTNSQLQALHAKLHIRTFTFNEPVFQEKQPGSGMYIIQKGSVDIVLLEGFKEPKILTTYHEGDFFGELALLDESPRSAAAISKENNVILLGFFRPDLIEMLASEPTIAASIIFNLAKILGARLRESNQMLRKLQCEQPRET